MLNLEDFPASGYAVSYSLCVERGAVSQSANK